MKKIYLLTLLLLIHSLAVAEIRVRPESWAAPIIGTSLENIYQVDKGVYRSEQPNSQEFVALSSYGLKEVLNLREYHSDDDEAEKTKLKLHRLKFATGSITEAQIIKALKIIKARQGPILVHCWHGSDRTGAVIAAYRIVFNNWSKERAVDELRNGGYGYHASIYPNIVKLINNLDVKKIKQQLAK